MRLSLLPRLVALLGLLLGLAGCAAREPPAIPLRCATVIECRATLSRLSRAWAGRPDGASDAHKWYEQKLLNRMAYFGRKCSRTETYFPACQLWLNSLHEHEAHYGA